MYQVIKITFGISSHSLNSSIGIKVTPETIGFDPGIRFWHRSVDGGSDDQYCVLTGYQYQPINIDDTHAEGQPEVLVIGGMTPFKEYDRSLRK